MPKQKQQRVSIFGRRFGKWKTIGFGRTSGQALLKGKQWASSTLGVSFKIGGKSIPKKIKGFKTKKTREGTIFIEKIGRRLKRGSGEIPEIQLYQGLNRGRR